MRVLHLAVRQLLSYFAATTAPSNRRMPAVPFLRLAVTKQGRGVFVRHDITKDGGDFVEVKDVVNFAICSTLHIHQYGRQNVHKPATLTFSTQKVLDKLYLLAYDLINSSLKTCYSTCAAELSKCRETLGDVLQFLGRHIGNSI